ncbi:hypothetical protein VII00023_10939 [Vibrio ichthyoenteri ATCC 700023]|uniref:Uncharacterized protein n=1 Tax=Vibrio ichthyoenteri ATCC 700023 TaxID=870968 RepID=F9S843_9VIBR|nr:DUF1254 domain-containing protein [Vibrio ichthyoenteri]EGU30520.1 hypothetical protein VII00023_10939 [Vibrio ichthyoenteri ATCC 700023]
MRLSKISRAMVCAVALPGLLAVTLAHATSQPLSLEQQITSISTPNQIETSIGTLQFLDGAPTAETASKVYDYLDTARAAEVFMKGMPAASVQALMDGPKAIGVDSPNKVLLFDNLMDSNSLFLTANTSTMYAMSTLDLKEWGPTVVEVPQGMLGAFNDAWFHYLGDIGPFGMDKGQGGKYLLLPPGYEGDVASGYHVIESNSYRVWVFMRANIKNGLEITEGNIRENLEIYPLSDRENPAETEFVSGSGKAFNTIHPNDVTFYEHLNKVVQYEPLSLIDDETRGLLASIGIEKGKEFNPDKRMQRILKDGVALGNAASRSIVWYPRTEGSIDNMSGVELYPDDANSNWIMAWVNRDVFFKPSDSGGINSDARVMFHYPYTAVTPAMAKAGQMPGKGSDYAIAYLDSSDQLFDGAKTYQMTVPANVPVADFWALTVYDSQTRSLLQTTQPFPSVGSQTEGLRANQDGSYTIYFAPKAPAGYEKNWVETIPGKSWFVAHRMYGPQKEWIEKTWRIGNVELVK